jgi:hypothetical protein
MVQLLTERPLDVDDTGAAVAGIAADVRPGQLQLVAEQLDEERARLDHHRDLLAIHLQSDPTHGSSKLMP